MLVSSHTTPKATAEGYDAEGYGAEGVGERNDIIKWLHKSWKDGTTRAPIIWALEAKAHGAPIISRLIARGLMAQNIARG
ncbi:hypothetical protein [Bradyrhizobium sp. ARR65]|uniref:hypothetical protein n=1 Tax=Bradyrhizobium sp. ARR65 TaxID=1040989 RepID=UPI000463DFB1|nr:hypothetical protein [Bradyrhizobium sp. ARR65]